MLQLLRAEGSRNSGLSDLAYDGMAPPDISLADVANAVTPRAIACAVLLGSVVCLVNMYSDLQAGMMNSMAMQSALLGFALFRSI